ncbi:aldo/keto reductase [bacterium]|nr:aldo/keto reductase [bacterium]
MQYREYGKTGVKVSALGYGAMRLPFDDPDLSVRLMQLGLDLGINYIDTAYGYGDEGRSEKLVGEAVKGRREQVILATKNPSWGPGGETAEGWWERLETSLERMQTDYLDFYKVIHSISWEVYERYYEPILAREVAKAKDQGLIRHVVFSVHDTPENIMKLVETGAFEGMLLQYNLLDRANEDAIARAHELGMGVEIMGPVGGGRLGMQSEKLTALVPDAATTAELALRFVLANPNVTIAFSGMNAEEQVRENCAAASREEPLSGDELEAIEKALIENRKLAELYCTGCEYCLPCEQGVAIPRIFAAMNMHRVWGLTEHAKRMYAHVLNEEKGTKQADACIECGQCEEKCPQKIKIMEQLRESHEALKV